MSNRFKNYEHVVRMAGLFLAGVALFLVARAILTPKDFGRYGFYRPAALDDIKAHKLSYAGHASCAECHSEQGRLDWEALGYHGDPMEWGGVGHAELNACPMA